MKTTSPKVASEVKSNFTKRHESDTLDPVYTIQPVVNNRLHHVNKHSTGCRTGYLTVLTTGCIV